MSEACLKKNIAIGQAIDNAEHVVGSSVTSVGKAQELVCKFADCSLQCVVQIEGPAVDSQDGEPVYVDVRGECAQQWV